MNSHSSAFHSQTPLNDILDHIHLDKPVYILIRHAEKHSYHYGTEQGSIEAIKQDYQDDHQLSAKGYERAQALVSYFLDRPEMQSLLAKCPLAAIFAQDVDTQPQPKGQSRRPMETVIPLWNAIQTRTDTSSKLYPPSHYKMESCLDRPQLDQGIQLYTKRNMENMIHALSSKHYTGKSILICWSHQTLPQLAHRLGASQVPEWKGKRYDMTWVVHGTQLWQCPQRLMYGDQLSTFKHEKTKTRNEEEED